MRPKKQSQLTKHALPVYVRQALDHPSTVNRNIEMLSVGTQLFRAGWEAEVILKKFLENYESDDMDEAEIIRVIGRAQMYAGEPGSRLTNDERGRLWEAGEKGKKISLEAREALEGVLRDCRWTYAEMEADSPQPIPDEPREQQQMFLKQMYNPEDILWMAGSVNKTGRPEHAAYFLTVEQIMRRHVQWNRFMSHATFQKGTTSRCLAKMKSTPYMVVESDVLDRDEIGAVFRLLEGQYGLPLLAAVYSGNFSVHGWFPRPSEDELKSFYRPLLIGLACDPSVATPTQPVRAPGAYRNDTEIQRLQKLVYLRGEL